MSVMTPRDRAIRLSLSLAPQSLTLNRKINVVVFIVPDPGWLLGKCHMLLQVRTPFCSEQKWL